VVVLPRQRRRLRQKVDAVPFWWHSIDLGHGVVTPGHKSTEALRAELDAMALPDLRGRSVLDVGGWDGFFAFEAERRGAARVAVVDHYMWSMDSPGQQAYWRRCMAEGVAPRPYHETEYWHPDTLPGKRGFDLAREALGSAVEPIVADFMTCDLDALGRWDVVLYLGVLYHMEEPLTALRRLAAVTRELAVVETEAVVVPGQEQEALWRFFPAAELNGDISNWWAPNRTALLGALRAAGFASARPTHGPPAELLDAPGGPHHYRLTAQAAR
jgi:tRNA (mo5U34)-methyltransferase